MIRFVIVMATGAIPPRLESYLAAPDVAELPFAPHRHVRWRDDAGTVHFSGWDQDQDPSATVDAQGLVAFAGSPRPAGQTWPVGRPMLDSVTALVRRPRFECSDLVDAFAVVRLDRDGTGVVGCDPLGLHPLYRGEAPGGVVVGNRADLVAEATARLRGDARPARDARTGAWLAFAGIPIGNGTGYEDVQLVDQHTSLRVVRGRLVPTHSPPLFARDPDAPPEDPSSVADELYADIALGLRHVVEQGDLRPDLEVTGGKDSRALCAVASACGLLERLRLVTYGPDGLADKAVAVRIADALGVPHHDISDLHYEAAATVPTLDRFRRHVHRSTGMSYCGDANEPRSHRRLTVSGLLGELFRTSNDRLAAAPVSSWDDAVQRFRVHRRFASAGLLRPEAAATLLDEATERHMSVWADLGSPSDLRGSWFLRNSLPRWQGAVVDLQEDRVRPFYSSRALRAAFGLGHRARTDELVHRALVARAPDLWGVPFANDRWRLRPSCGPEPLTDGNGIVSAKAPTPEAGPSAEALAVRAVVDAAPSSPLYDHVDETAMRRAAQHFDELSRHDQRQVLGATTGLIWLGHLELPSRPPIASSPDRVADH